MVLNLSKVSFQFHLLISDCVLLGNVSIQQITNKLRTMEIVEEFESSIHRQIDEVDILNILEGHIHVLLDEMQIGHSKVNVLFDRNNQYRLKRIDQRIQFVNILQNHIEKKRLKRKQIFYFLFFVSIENSSFPLLFIEISLYSGSMNLEEMTALVLEDIPRFEKLTNIHLTEDDIRIISMNRFGSIERSLNRNLTESEYRYLLENYLPFNYVEEQLLKRSLTREERIEQEELTFLSYHELFPDNTSVDVRNLMNNLEQQNIKLTRLQLEQVNNEIL